MAQLAGNGAQVAQLAENAAQVAQLAENGAQVAQLAESGTQVAQLAENGAQVAQLAENGAQVAQLAENGAQVAQLAKNGAHVAQHDYEGAFACCVRSEHSAAHHDWDARSDEGQQETRLHRCTEVSVLAGDRGDAEPKTRLPTKPATTAGLSGCGCVEARWQLNQGVTLELQSAAVNIERGNYVRLLEHCHKNVKLYNNK